MSAEIIRFVARPKPDREPTELPTITFGALGRSKEPASADADTAPCEYVRPENGEA